MRAERARGSLTHHLELGLGKDENAYARRIHWPPSTVPLGKNLWLPGRLPPKLSRNSKFPERSSSRPTSAGAPTFKVPRSRKISKVREALAVAHAMAAGTGMPRLNSFDMQFGRSITPVVRLLAVQSVENVSGQKPVFMMLSIVSHLI